MHKEEYMPNDPQRIIETSFVGTVHASTCSDSRAKRITDLIVKCTGFLRLMGFVEPGYCVPSTTHISTLVEKRFLDLQSKLKVKISTDLEAVSFTSDIWKMMSFVLSTEGFPERHTGVNISEATKKIIVDFNISEERVVSVVHDKAPIMSWALTFCLSSMGGLKSSVLVTVYSFVLTLVFPFLLLTEC